MILLFIRVLDRWTITFIFSSKRKIVLEWKHSLLPLLAIAIMVTLLTNRCNTKNNLLWLEILIMLLSVPQSLKLLSKYFLPHSTFMWWHVECSPRGLHIIWFHWKNNIKKKLRPLSKEIVLASEYYYTRVSVLLFIFLRRFITLKLSPDRV